MNILVMVVYHLSLILTAIVHSIVIYCIPDSSIRHLLSGILMIEICVFERTLDFLACHSTTIQFKMYYHGTLLLFMYQWSCSLVSSSLSLFSLFISFLLRWLILALSWFLAARLQWGNESIASLSIYFHSFGWGIPSILSLVLLINESIDGDVFSGVCSVRYKSLIKK